MFCALRRPANADALPGAAALKAAVNGWIEVTAAPPLNCALVIASWIGLKPTCWLRFQKTEWIERSRYQPGLLDGPAARLTDTLTSGATCPSPREST